ncbi:MAG: GreA/GreB family elongation factor [Phycisphaerales bacterium]
MDINYKDKIRITEFDALRLEQLIYAAQTRKGICPWHARLRLLLDTAEVVASEKIGADTVTMNAKVLIGDKVNREQVRASLVFPTSSLHDNDEINVSVLSPLGLSILGQKIGYEIEGRLKLINMVYQPEAAGDFEV